MVKSLTRDPEIEGLILAAPGTGSKTKRSNTALNKRTHNYEEKEITKPAEVAEW